MVDEVRVRVRGVGLGLELEQCFERRSGDRTWVTVFVTSRRYRQTNSAQALKETNRLGLGLGLWSGQVRVAVWTGIRLRGIVSSGLGLG